MRTTRNGRSLRSGAFETRDGDAERRQSEQDNEQRQLGERHAGEGQGGKEQRRAAAAMRHQKPDPSRDQQSGGRRRNPAEDVPKHGKVSMLKVQGTERQSDRPR